jgi:hypothetical protein
MKFLSQIKQVLSGATAQLPSPKQVAVDWQALKEK